MKAKNISAVVVLYNPNLNLIKQVLSLVSCQVRYIIVVDNTPNSDIGDEFCHFTNLVYIPLNANIGIAKAQNLGIERSFELGVDFVFFLDQDSIIESNMVDTLYGAYVFLSEQNVQVGAVGPRPFNRLLNKKYEGTFVRGTAFSKEITEVNELISSASLVPIHNFTDVGGLDSSLFIDGVDHEWCWRAKYLRNYRFFIVESTKLSHQVGEGDRFFLSFNILIPTPFRVYYLYRNFVKLLIRSYVPIYWKLSNGVKLLFKMFYFPLFVKPRFVYLKRIFKGIVDGFLH